jgi:16S rRNA (cytosine1402-N4)-methyltransferase
MGHIPVLSNEVGDLLVPALAGGGVVVDATVGYGGHAAVLLERAPRAELVGIDRDPEALEASRAHLSSHQGRVRLVRGDFEDLEAILERLGPAEVRGVLFDLGVSSPQMDEARRGFGYRAAGPLDMRMDPSGRLSALEVVNAYPAERLASVIKRYGEERFAPRVAQAIVAARPIETTDRLAEVVRAAIPAATRRTGGHPARRTFQAIRIEVNDELDALRRALPVALEKLSAGGRIAVISYHSLEDRIVKRRLAEEARDCVCPPDFPVCRCEARARVRILTRRPIRPSSAELETNPRSSSARLRTAEKLETPAA